MAEFGFTRRIRERKAKERALNRKLLKWLVMLVVGYLGIVWLGLSWYFYHQGDKTLVEALSMALSGFGAELALVGDVVFKETWPSFVLLFVFIGCFFTFIAYLARDRGERQTPTMLYQCMAADQRTIKVGSPKMVEGFQLALDSLSEVLASNPGLHSQCLRLFDDMADDIKTGQEQRALTPDWLAVVHILDSFGNALEKAMERRDELLSNARLAPPPNSPITNSANRKRRTDNEENHQTG